MIWIGCTTECKINYGLCQRLFGSNAKWDPFVVKADLLFLSLGQKSEQNCTQRRQTFVSFQMERTLYGLNVLWNMKNETGIHRLQIVPCFCRRNSSSMVNFQSCPNRVTSLKRSLQLSSPVVILGLKRNLFSILPSLSSQGSKNKNLALGLFVPV